MQNPPGQSPDDFHSSASDLLYLASLFRRYLAGRPVSGSLLVIACVAPWLLIGTLNVFSFRTIGHFVDALSEHSTGQAWHWIMLFCLTGLASACAQAVGDWSAYTLKIHWRSYFTEAILKTWFEQKNFYLRSRILGSENPEQRVQEDLSLIINGVLELVPSICQTGAQFFSAAGVLLGISQFIPFVLGQHRIYLPGGLVSVALISGLLIAIATHFVGRNLAKIEFVRQKFEADFRRILGDTREFAEAIAMEGGVARANDVAVTGFCRIRGNWSRYRRSQVQITLFTNTVNLGSLILPRIFCIYAVMHGQMTIGTIGVATATFLQVEQVFSVISVLYPQIAILRACMTRIQDLEREFEPTFNSGIATAHTSASGMTITDLRLLLPSGKPLLSVAKLEFHPGERLLLEGRSGTGKSTLLKAVAGIWPYAQGRIAYPEGARLQFLPQRIFMPEGSLIAALSYPGEPDSYKRVAYLDALDAVGLGGLQDYLHEYADWSSRLSPGEQQRIGAARAILSKPDFLFLDEISSSLDLASERVVYESLIYQLPHASIVSIGHRPSLREYHDRTLEISNGLSDNPPPNEDGSSL